MVSVLRAASAAVVLLFSTGVFAALPLAVPGKGDLPSLADMLDEVNPAVVNIKTYSASRWSNPLREHPFFRRYYRQPRRSESRGSGVIVDAGGGYIITNNHVVERADEISIQLADGRSLSAKLVGRDPQVDLAVLQVDPEGLSEIEFADSSTLRVGDFVVAIGNPFGLTQTVTSGIVSALGRSGLGIEGYEDFIQTDASINPGNSGGALVDLRGRLVGINTAIIAPSGGNVGIGFAIPANMVRAIMEQLIEYGEVRRGLIGLIVQSLNAELARAFGVAQREGVVVGRVEPGSPADKAGLQPGDIITRVGQREINKLSDFHSQAAVMFIGDEVGLQVLRDGRRRSVALEITEQSQQRVSGQQIDARLTGLDLENFWNPEEPGLSAGVLATYVEPSSAAFRYGLRAGDVIVGANRIEVHDLSDLQDAVRDARQIVLRVYRNGSFGSLVIR
ncbi:MAG: Do family serine endopeptidase [Pseudomonadota bacterium]